MRAKSLFPSALTLGVAALALGVALAPLEAHAGFQWVPGDQGDSATASSLSQAPVSQAPVSQAPVAAEPLAPEASGAVSYPQIIEGAPPKADLPEATPVDTSVSLPPVAAPAAKPAAIAEKAAPADDKPVRGFANSVPLSVALRQILPQDYGFSVAQDVSLGTLVSWRGGNSWRQTLKDMLAPNGLTIKEQGRMVHIVHDSGAPTLASDAPSSQPSLNASPAPAPLMAEPSASLGDGVHYVEGRKPVSLVAPAGANAVSSRPLSAAASPASAGSLTSALDRPVALTSASVSKPVVSSMRTGLPNQWEADKGEMLHKVLEAWAKRANVELSWQAEYDYPLQASVSLTGTFEEAVRALLIGFQDAKPQPVGEFYNNQVAGQAILVVQAHGNNYNE